MPDAREKLKSLAAEGRHKGRLLGGTDGRQPSQPKRIKRSGATRPYQQGEKFHEPSFSEAAVVAESLNSGNSPPAEHAEYLVVAGLPESQLGNSIEPNYLAEETYLPKIVTEDIASFAKPERYRPSTVGRARELVPPKDELDLNRDDRFVEKYLLSVLGTREFALFRGYRAMYEQARRNQDRTLFFRRPELALIFGSDSSATVTRTLKKGIALGLFQMQTFSLKGGEIKAGTYIHLCSPWLKDNIFS